MARFKHLVGVLAIYCMLIDDAICQYDDDGRSRVGDIENQNPFYNGRRVVERNTHDAGDNHQRPSDNNANNRETEHVKNKIEDVFKIPINHKHRKRRQSFGVLPVGLSNPNWFFNSAQRFTRPPSEFPAIPLFPGDIYGGFYDAFKDPATDQSGNQFSNVFVPNGYPQLNNFFLDLRHPQFTPWRINSQWFSPLFFIPVYCDSPYLPPREQPGPDKTTTAKPPIQTTVNMTFDDRFGTDRNWGPVDSTTGRPIMPNDINTVARPTIPNNQNEVGNLPSANPDGDDDENYTIREISFDPVQPSRQPSVTPPPVEHSRDAPSVPKAPTSASASGSASVSASASASATANSAGNNILGDFNFNIPDNKIIPPAVSNLRPDAPRPVQAGRTPSPPRQFTPSIRPQARPLSPRPQVTSSPTLNQKMQTSPCVLAIIACCVPNSEQVKDNCFESFGCAGPFWDRSPCSSEIARNAIRVFRQLDSQSTM